MPTPPRRALRRPPAGAWAAACWAAVGCAGPDPRGAAPDSAGPAPDSGWPAPVEIDVPDAHFIVNGQVLLDGDRLPVPTPPAGWPAALPLTVTVRHNGGAALTLSELPDDWLSGAGWSLVGPLPGRLGPGQTAALQLQVSAEGAAPGALPAVLQLPTPGGPALHLQGEVPAAQRLVIAEDDGELLISDDNGHSFTRGSAGVGGRPAALAAGGGRWLLALDDGAGGAAYRWSADGARWAEAEAAPAPAPAACAFALGRFVCAREDSLSWSDRGESVVHVASGELPALRGLAGAEGALLGVGDAGRICRSDVAEAWRSEARFPTGEAFTDLAGPIDDDAGAEVHLATTGHDHQRLLRTTDAGRTWSERPLCGAPRARLIRVLSAGPRALAAGEGAGCPALHASADHGHSWRPAAPPAGPLRLLGPAGAGFLALHIDAEGARRLLRTEDGEAWVEVLRLGAGEEPRLAAQAPWAPEPRE